MKLLNTTKPQFRDKDKMILIKNLRKNTPLGPHDVYCGRFVKYRPELGGSVLANPFRGPDREENISRYRKHLQNATVEMGQELVRLKEYHSIHGELGLACWCFPLPCHCDVIKEFLEEGQFYD